MKLNQIQTPTPANLSREFQFIRQATYQGINGVFVVDSGITGPTIGITMHTHGNEPAGLAALWYARNVLCLHRRLVRGRIMFVLNNIEAARMYFSARTMQQKRDARFFELNMNRLPEGLAKDQDTYEVKRARELLPIWQQFESALDIHSIEFAGTPEENAPMIIEVTSDKRIEKLIQRFPIGLRFTDVERFQLRKPMISFCGDPKKPRIPAVGMESGSHTGPESFNTAIACTLAFLGEHGVIESPIELPIVSNRKVYRFVGRLLFSNDTWSLVKVFKPYEYIRKGMLLATNTAGAEMRAWLDAYAIFPPKAKTKTKAGDEVMFFAVKE